MGYVAHDALIVTVGEWFLTDPRMPDLYAFRMAMPDKWKPLLVGPVQAIVSGDQTWFFGPDGSNDGWDIDAEGDRLREEFASLCSLRFEDGSSPFSVVFVQYGADMQAEDKLRTSYV